MLSLLLFTIDFPMEKERYNKWKNKRSPSPRSESSREISTYSSNLAARDPEDITAPTQPESLVDKSPASPFGSSWTVNGM